MATPTRTIGSTRDKRPARPSTAAVSRRIEARPSPQPGANPTANGKPEPKILFQKFFHSVGPRTYASQVKELPNRNHLLVLLKHSRHILLLTAAAFVGMLFVEGVFWLLLKRRWSLMQATAIEPVCDCWRLRAHVRAKRRQVQEFRQRGDGWMLRFFCWRLGRAGDLKKLFKFGAPKIG